MTARQVVVGVYKAAVQYDREGAKVGEEHTPLVSCPIVYLSLGILWCAMEQISKLREMTDSLMHARFLKMHLGAQLFSPLPHNIMTNDLMFCFRMSNPVISIRALFSSSMTMVVRCGKQPETLNARGNS